MASPPPRGAQGFVSAPNPELETITVNPPVEAQHRKQWYIGLRLEDQTGDKTKVHLDVSGPAQLLYDKVMFKTSTWEQYKPGMNTYVNYVKR